MTSIVAVALALGASVAMGAAQKTPAPRSQEPLTFGSDVRMIRLDVSVVDRLGRPVRGLMPENFVVHENGRRVELTVFEAIEDGAPATSTTGLDGPGRSLAVNAEASRQPPSQRIVIVADPSGLTPMQLARIRDATAEFILVQAKTGDIVRVINLATREITEGRIPEDRMRLAAIGRQLSRHRKGLMVSSAAPDSIAEQRDFGMDPDVAESFTQSLRTERFLSQFARTGELLSLFDEILIQLAAIPGRKSLILISDGFPEMRHLQERLQRTAHLARDAQAAIHFVDAYGLDGLLPESSGERLKSPFEMAWSRSGGSQDLAEATGGFVARFANVLTGALARAAEEARSYYIVGYAPMGRDDGRFRKVKVRVNRGEVTVRTKKGYIAGRINRG